MHQFSYKTRSGVKINVADSQTSGPPVVFFHGVTRRWQDWLTVLPQFAPFGRCLALDFRGHGLSDRTPGAYRVVEYVPDLVEFICEELEEPAFIIGHSLGGNLAVAVAAQAAGFVRGVVLEDPPLTIAGPRLNETPFPSAFRAFIKYAGSQLSTSEIAARLAEEHVQAPGRAERVRLGELRDAASLRFSAYCLQSLDPEVLECPLQNRWMEGLDINDALAQIEAPTLLIQADVNMGGILPDSEASAAIRLIREVTHIKLSGVGHNIHSNAAEAFLRLVIPFLASLG